MAEEWIIIGILAVAVLYLWGMKKIPDVARAAGKAARDFQEAYKQGASEFQKAYKDGATSSENQQKGGSDLLISTAQKLGINTEGKTREQISEEIIQTAKGGKPVT